MGVRARVVAAVLTTACGDATAPADATSGGSEVDTTRASTSDDGSSGGGGDPLPPRPDAIACSFAGHAPGLLPPITTAPALDGSAVVDLAAVPGSGTSYLLRADGTLAAVTGDEIAELFDLSDRGSRMIALALPPDHAETGQLFVRYEAAGGLARSVVLRLTVADGAIDEASARVVIELGDVVGEGSGGALAFDEDGLLLIGVGDGAVDPIASLARDPSSRRGKLLRIDPGPLDDTGTWAIPDDNPFADTGPGFDPLIFATGLRDPWRCTYAPGDPAAWCIDRGLARQELHRVEAGADLGWPLFDGGTCTLPGGDCGDAGTIPPTTTYPLDDDDCGAAGVVVVGDAPVELAGALLTADRCSGRVRGLDLVHPGALVNDDVLGVAELAVAGLAIDDAGRILLFGPDGAATLAVEPSDAVFPSTLSQSGCFGDLTTLAPSPGVVPYDINAPLWTDGALKRRFIVLPPGETIAVDADDGTLVFPVGTVLLKNFSFPTEGDPEVMRTVETRAMVRHTFGWQFHGYRWNDEGTDAELLLDGVRAPITIATGVLEYEWPTRDDCRTCHGSGESMALGPRLDQLDRAVDYGHVVADQLDALAGIGMFAAPLPSERTPIVDYHDEDAPLEQRARAWLHGNCGHCHRPGGWTPPELTLDLRWSTALADTSTCNVPLQYWNGWVPGDTRIVPGDPEASVIWQRLQLRGPGQMPPIATSVPDPASDVVRAWIAELDGCP